MVSREGGPPTQFRQLYFAAKSYYQKHAPRKDRRITEEPLNRRTSRQLYRVLQSRTYTVGNAVDSPVPPVSSPETAQNSLHTDFNSLQAYFYKKLKFKLTHTQTLKIGSLNVEGLYDALKYELLKQYMRRKN